MHRQHLAGCRLVLAWALLCLAAPAQALQPGRVEWGFDGRVTPMTFNMVTIDVVNNSTKAYEGDIALIEGGGVSASKIPLVEKDVYIEPGGTRRIQFFPFLSEQWAEYRLAWGQRFSETMPIADSAMPVRFGPPATVVLQSFSRRPSGIRLPTFDDDIFPISAAGTDGLAALLIDYTPRWDVLRAQALRDWVAAGGKVHLFQDDKGEFPKFDAPLEVFNEPSEQISVGAGRVYRHPRRLATIDDTFIRNELGIAPNAHPSDDYNARRGFDYDYQWSPMNTLLPMLRSLTRPTHNWGLIYALSFAYLAVIFPGCWLIGRRRADFRVLYPLLIGAICLFSFAFRTVGRRGYGESTAWNSVGIAKPLGNDRWLVQCWSNAFVTAGGLKSYQHEADGLIYSPAGSDEGRNGECVNRPNAAFNVEIPPYSSQAVLHTGIVTGPKLDVRLQKSDFSNPAPSFELRIDGSLPTNADVQCLYGNTLYKATLNGPVYKTGVGIPVSQVIRPDQNYGGYRYGSGDDTTPFQNADTTLMASALRVRSDTTANELNRPTDRLTVFVYGEAAPQFLAVRNGPEKLNGRILSVFDLPIDGATAAESAAQPADAPMSPQTPPETAPDAPIPAAESR
jgi:hypothetical protein